ncbi:MAG: DMT family transporter [Chloroflexi bacterium]|nr:DMT family transporter [Chloroflexota bacterium]
MGRSVPETVRRLTTRTESEVAEPEPSSSASTDPRRPLTLRAGGLAFTLASLWAGLPIAVKAGLEDSPPLRLGFARFILGMIVVIIWAIITRQSFRVTRSEIFPLLVLGILFSVQTAFMNLGQYNTTAGHTGVLITTFPLWAGVFAHFLVPNDNLSKRRVIGAFIAYTGAAGLFVRSIFGGTDAIDALNPWLGDLLIMCSAVLLGLRQVYLSQLGQSITLVKLLMAQGIFGSVTFLVGSLIFEADPIKMTMVLAMSLFYQGVIIAGFAFLGQTWLLKNYLPSRVSLISLSSPITTAILSWLILGENIGPELWFGAVLVIVGSYIAQRS